MFEKSALWKVKFHSVKGLTVSHMPSGLFIILAAKSLPHSVDIDLRLMYQICFSLIQHQKTAYRACLSSALMALQTRHCSCSLTTFHVEHSATAPFQASVESTVIS